jgi:hypothetical protein
MFKNVRNTKKKAFDNYVESWHQEVVLVFSIMQVEDARALGAYIGFYPALSFISIPVNNWHSNFTKMLINST